MSPHQRDVNMMHNGSWVVSRLLQHASFGMYFEHQGLDRLRMGFTRKKLTAPARLLSLERQLGIPDLLKTMTLEMGLPHQQQRRAVETGGKGAEEGVEEGMFAIWGISVHHV